MIVDIVAVGPLGVNCCILGCPETKQGVVVDPGGDVELIMETVVRHGLTVATIVNTHGHFDHVGGNRRLKELTGARLLIHAADEPMLSRVASVAGMYGLQGENSPAPDGHLSDGMSLSYGNCTLRVLHTPGHTPGGCCLYLEQDGKIITGDTLFADGIGRTDLPGGSYEQLAESIRTRLFTLPDEVIAYPGHGPATTIGHEKQHNPYLD